MDEGTAHTNHGSHRLRSRLQRTEPTSAPIADLDLTFIEQWPAHVEAIQKDGIRVVMPGETLVMPVRESGELAAAPSKADLLRPLVNARG
jgi:hypothetical protein